jgi:hypothetical protein
MRQTHATQHIGSLGELDIVVADDLDAVAPGIANTRSRSRVATLRRGDNS